MFHQGTFPAPVRRTYMKKLFSPISLALAPLALLAACSSQSSDDADPAAEDGSSAAAPADPAASKPSAPDAPDSTEPPDAAAQAADILSLTGLGDLRIGEAVPANSSWGEKGAQVSDACRVLSSPDYPGAYAIAEGDKVRRISIGQRSAVTLAEGIGPGAREADVKKHFPFPETPHKYVEAPAKYLTAPNAGSGTSALRFEIGSDGKVSQIHVGTMPVLGYVEACS